LPNPLSREVLPGAIEPGRIHDLASKINDICRSATLDLAYRVGELVIAEIYQGNVDSWAREGTRNVSYRKLSQRADLLMSPSALCRAVAVYSLCERIGGRTTWRHLTASHLQEVLPLPSGQQERLLHAAEAERWPVARLREEVSKRRPARRRPRRPRLPKVMALLEAFRELVDDEVVAGLRADPEAPRALQELVADVQRSLERIEKALHGTTEGAPRASSEMRLKCVATKSD
jgi:hypothetical protein